MSESITCPYCETKVKMYQVDADDGTCPECGAPLLGSILMAQQEEADFDDDDVMYRDADNEDNFDGDEDEDEFFGDDEED